MPGSVTDGWGGESPFGVPCIVVTHRVGDQPDPASGFEFVDGVAEAVDRARRIAGDKAVGIGGGPASPGRHCRPRWSTSCRSTSPPVILGAGRTLFGELGTRVPLERTRVLDSPYASHIRYRVAK